MAIINTGSFPKALWPGVHRWWGAKYDQHEVQYTQIFDVRSSKKNFEEVVQSSGFGLVPVKEEGDGVKYDNHTQGYTSRFVHAAFGLGYIVTFEEKNDNLYSEVSMPRASSLAFSCRQTEERVGANVINNGFDANFTGGDGTEMINTAHPNFTGGTQSNRSSTDAALSETALEQACIDIAKWETDRGLLINEMPTQLIVPSELQFEAKRILGSEGRTTASLTAAFGSFTSGATSDINAINAMGKFSSYFVNNYLTSTTAWFLRTSCPYGPMNFERESMVFAPDNDFDTENAKYKATERYSFGWTDWRGIYGSDGV